MINDKKIPVRSRTSATVSYQLDNMRAMRKWSKPGLVVDVPLEELKELLVHPGGEYLLKHSLVIEDEQAKAEIFGYELPPEYDYSEEEIKALLYESSDDALLDCLDYAPNGVIELLKRHALTKLPNTTAKITALNNKLGINILNTIKLMEDSSSETEVEVVKQRRTAPVEKKSRYEVVQRG